MSYTKLANSILTSTIWMEDDHTRLVWVALLAMADKNGEVQASIPGLANVARVPIASAEIAIQKFLSPDLYSRTKDADGRRIEVIKGGWALINHAEYRNLASEDDRKAKAAERQKRFRERQKQRDGVTDASQTPQKSRQIPQAEAVTDSDSKADLGVTPTPSVAGSARERATHTGRASLIREDWQPSEIAIAQLRKGRPDLVGAFFDQRMTDFRLWCRDKAVMSHDPEAAWLGFMRKSLAAPTNGAGHETADQRRIREGMAVVHAYEADLKAKAQ